MFITDCFMFLEPRKFGSPGSRFYFYRLRTLLVPRYFFVLDSVYFFLSTISNFVGTKTLLGPGFKMRFYIFFTDC